MFVAGIFFGVLWLSITGLSLSFGIIGCCNACRIEQRQRPCCAGCSPPCLFKTNACLSICNFVMFFFWMIVLVAIIAGDIDIFGIVTYFTYFFVTSGAAYKLHTIKSKWHACIQRARRARTAVFL